MEATGVVIVSGLSSGGMVVAYRRLRGASGATAAAPPAPRTLAREHARKVPRAQTMHRACGQAHIAIAGMAGECQPPFPGPSLSDCSLSCRAAQPLRSTCLWGASNPINILLRWQSTYCYYATIQRDDCLCTSGTRLWCCAAAWLLLGASLLETALRWSSWRVRHSA